MINYTLLEEIAVSKLHQRDLLLNTRSKKSVIISLKYPYDICDIKNDQFWRHLIWFLIMMSRVTTILYFILIYICVESQLWGLVGKIEVVVRGCFIVISEKIMFTYCRWRCCRYKEFSHATCDAKKCNLDVPENICASIKVLNISFFKSNRKAKCRNAN